MSLQDPLSDLFSRIRNAQMRNKPIVSSPVSKLRENILEVLKNEGYIRGYARTKHSSGREELDIELKYDDKGPVISEITGPFSSYFNSISSSSLPDECFVRAYPLM